jgi:hypothetical protein
MTEPPKQRTETAVERALNHAFPRTAFKVEIDDALDKLAVHWRGGPSHQAVNDVIGRAGRRTASNIHPPTHSLARWLNSKRTNRSKHHGHDQ